MFGPIAQRQSRGLIIPWFLVRIQVGPMTYVKSRFFIYPNEEGEEITFNYFKSPLHFRPLTGHNNLGRFKIHTAIQSEVAR